MLALYIGGMGAREMNFHFDVFVRMGFEEARPTRSRTLYLDGHKEDAAAAVPTAMVEDIALIGPRCQDRSTTWPPGRSPSPPLCWWPATPPPSG